MEEDLYERIGESDLNPTYKDGQVYQHTDVNNMLSILKTAVNENYYDIQRLENGTNSVGNANKLDNATISRYIDETLQSDDNKVPSSQQVRAYVEDRLSDFNPPVRGVDYWTEEDQEYIIDESSAAVLSEVNEEVEQAIADMRDAEFVAFDVVDGKLIAGYSRENVDYYFQLNGNKLEVVLYNE